MINGFSKAAKNIHYYQYNIIYINSIKCHIINAYTVRKKLIFIILRIGAYILIQKIMYGLWVLHAWKLLLIKILYTNGNKTEEIAFFLFKNASSYYR